MEPRLAGRRPVYLALEQITGRVPAKDGYVNTWSEFARAWAEVRPALAGTDYAVSQTQQTPLTHVVRLDYHPDLSAADRFRILEVDPAAEDAPTLYIRHLTDEDLRHVTHVALCEERIS